MFPRGRNGSSVIILNMRENQASFGQNGTTKIPSAFLAFIFFKTLGMIENGEKA